MDVINIEHCQHSLILDFGTSFDFKFRDQTTISQNFSYKSYSTLFSQKYFLKVNIKKLKYLSLN